MKAHTMTKKIVTLLLAVCLLVPSCLVLPASATVSNDINDILFDYEYYYNKYPDLQRAFGKNASALYNHYLTYGKKEGRCPSSLFDPVYYVNKYSDLKAAFGNDYTKLYQHFVNYGIKEGRQASAAFNVTIYKNNYADLRNAFGTDGSNNWKYLQHWRNYGQSEQRNAVSAISSSTTSTSTSTSTSSSGTTAYVKTAGGNLNLRSSASTSGKILAKLANGTQVTVYSTSNGWSRIKAGSTEGYVSSQYISYNVPSTNTGGSTSSAFQMPMDNAYCTWRTPGSNMSWGSYNSNSSGRNYHLGIDIYGTNGTVKATAAGQVAATGYNSANGNYVVLKHTINGKTIYSFYAHLQSISVSNNTSVSAGQKIAVAGKTGSAAAGTHLHFALVDQLKTTGSYYGYATSFSGNKTTYGGVTYYNPLYVINNQKLP